MLLTREADYALRLMRSLGESGKKLDARALCETTAIPFRFSLKILGKLSLAGLVISKPGAGGGYTLARAPDEITLYDVLNGIGEAPDWNRCTANEDYICEYRDAGGDCRGCAVHMLLADAQSAFCAKLKATTVEQIMLGQIAVTNQEKTNQQTKFRRKQV